MVEDLLSVCLRRCERLAYQLVEVESPAFDAFRSSALHFLKSHDEIESPQQTAIRKRLWRLIFDLSSTPIPWSQPLAQHLGFGQRTFVELVRENFGHELVGTAEELTSLWQENLPSAFPNGGPLFESMKDSLSNMRNAGVDFRILATARQQDLYADLLEQLVLKDEDIFCTLARLKALPPFDCLVTCGPFREDDDAIFTAPRWGEIFNIRWGHDRDVEAFPTYLSSNQEIADLDDTFPEDFPCKITTTKVRKSFPWTPPPAEPSLPAHMKPTAWSFSDFEALFLKRRRRRRLSTASVCVESAERPHSSYAFVKLTFFDESYLIQPFDQQGKPPLIYSIDVDDASPGNLRKRRASEDPFEISERVLLPGMLAIIEPEATGYLKTAATELSATETFHLQRWKKQLRLRLKQLKRSRKTLMFDLQMKNMYSDTLHAGVPRWAEYQEGKILAPGNEADFRQLVGDYLGYSDVDAAWLEIETLRGGSISDGLMRESSIEQYLVQSVQQRIDELADNSKSLLDVEGFEDPVIVIEITRIDFLNQHEATRSHVGKLIDPYSDFLDVRHG